MHCRRISDLLSAYIDAELADDDRRMVEAHLRSCAQCRAERDGLQETKCLLAALAQKTPRAEIERLLVPSVYAEQASPGSGALWWDTFRRIAATPVRPRMVAVTALLSLAGMWLASARLGGPGHEDGPRLAVPPLDPPLMPVSVGFSPGGTIGGGGSRFLPDPDVSRLPSSLLAMPAPRRRPIESPISLAAWPRQYRSNVVPAVWYGPVWAR